MRKKNIQYKWRECLDLIIGCELGLRKRDNKRDKNYWIIIHTHQKSNPNLVTGRLKTYIFILQILSFQILMFTNIWMFRFSNKIQIQILKNIIWSNSEIKMKSSSKWIPHPANIFEILWYNKMTRNHTDNKLVILNYEICL